MTRKNRNHNEARSLDFKTHFIKNAIGSVLVQAGDTSIICTVQMEDNVPSWMRKDKEKLGWITAEYAMIPGANKSRTKRERPQPSGRSLEIQRLISRSLRAVADLKAIPGKTLTIDCDVINADGSTRTTAITGAFVALSLASQYLMRKKVIKKSILTDGVCAISVGINPDEIWIDLDHREDTLVDIDLNVIMTHKGEILEIQGGTEGNKRYPWARWNIAVEAALKHLPRIQTHQLAAIESAS